MARNNKLRATDIDGVYTNELGEHVDARGVSVAFQKLKQKDADQRREVLGFEVTEPHHLLKAISLDPRYPLTIRVDCAKSAAPYFAAKKLDRGEGGDGDAEALASKVREALDAADATVGMLKPVAAAKQGARK